ncbi:MAG: glycoside hydrolase family 2, partial [Paramuribaculum sp.]|nr:glycoside hydrolase family 2 [Paramuribaculum sp.]
LKAVFDDLGITPDITFDVDDGAPLFIHRETSDAQIYFLANPLEKTCSVIPEFRVKQNLKPQVWNPVTGEIRALPQYAAGSNKGISVPITMNPLESIFIVFVDNHGAGKGDDNFSPAEIVADITHGPWTISFDPSRGGPDTPVVCDSLFDWTTHPDYNISHYSGNAVYTTVFDLDSEPEGDILLDLGHVMVMGKVRVNGMETGGVWTPPYVVDITSAVRPGKNKIEVDVVSTWRNRLIGDATLDAENRVTSLNLNFFDGTEPLQPSGLIGPVRILKRTY